MDRDRSSLLTDPVSPTMRGHVLRTLDGAPAAEEDGKPRWNSPMAAVPRAGSPGRGRQPPYATPRHALPEKVKETPAPKQRWEGRWTPLRVDCVPQVVAEVQDFVGAYRRLKAEVHGEVRGAEVPRRAVVYADARLKEMLRSAQLRLDILMHFYTQNKKDRRCEKVKDGIRELKRLLSDEGIEDDPFMQEAPPVAEEADRDSEAEQAEKELQEKALQEATLREEQKKLELAAKELPDERIRALNEEVVMKSRRVEQVQRRLDEVGLEKHAVDRSLLEMCEARERMKAIVEEQIYTVTLMTKVSSLLHLELRRSLFRTVARGMLFWSFSFVLAFHTLRSCGSNLSWMYVYIRSYLDDSAGFTWYGLLADVLLVCIAFALLFEWIAFARNDLDHGAGSWCLDSIVTARDDAVESARVEQIRHAEQLLSAEYIPLDRYKEMDADEGLAHPSSSHHTKRSLADESAQHDLPFGNPGPIASTCSDGESESTQAMTRVGSRGRGLRLASFAAMNSSSKDVAAGRTQTAETITRRSSEVTLLNTSRN
eukprot:TRINITY_DN4386_c0_g2_i1.p1 TRINITY_DN4386_c0_g2~~TRINITY_DN4386_c0_g2_i1.p1  ORF type:complete len:579 (+),score=217.32 TRINITY_DN4386_c0_g2_i1:119-1738(+)